MADNSAQSTAPSGGVAVMWFIVNTWSLGDNHLMSHDSSLRSANTFALVSSLSLTVYLVQNSQLNSIDFLYLKR